MSHDTSSESSPIRVGVLALHESTETKAILNAVEDLGHEAIWLREENVSIAVRDGTIELEPDVDIVVNRLLLSNTDQPAESLGLAATYGSVRPVLNEPAAVMTALHKYATAATLVEADIPVPDSFLALDSYRLNAARGRFGSRAVYKTAIGTHGGGTWFVDLDELVNPTVGTRRAFLQEFVETDGDRHHDYRIYVVDGTVVGAMKRTAQEGEWRTNVAVGGHVEDASDVLSETVFGLARRAAAAIGLDYAGVDIVGGEDEWYVLEVNPTAGYKGLFSATGRSPGPYIAKLAIEHGGGAVDDEHVERLAERLDGSEPASGTPSTFDGVVTPPIVGQVERVTVSGTSGTESVIARVDTGADRTSIDLRVAAAIGAGPITRVTRVRSGSDPEGTTRPMVDLVVGMRGHSHTVTASVEDRSHMRYPALLGRDVLQHYHVDVSRGIDEE